MAETLASRLERLMKSRYNVGSKIEWDIDELQNCSNESWGGKKNYAEIGAVANAVERLKRSKTIVTTVKGTKSTVGKFALQWVIEKEANKELKELENKADSRTVVESDSRPVVESDKNDPACEREHTDDPKIKEYIRLIVDRYKQESYESGYSRGFDAGFEKGLRHRMNFDSGT